MIENNILLKAGPPAYGGYTLGRVSEEPGAKIVLINGAISGEVVEVSIDEEKRDYYLASVVRVIEPSPNRIKPEFEPCPGCQFEYIDYDEQVRMKEEVIADSLRRIGGVGIKLAEPLILKNNTWGYRYRGQFKVSGDKIGFYKEKTREIIDMDFSPLMIDEINRVLKKVHDAIHDKPRWFIDITEVHIAYGDGVFALVKTTPKIKAAEGFLERLALLFLDLDLDGIYIDIGGKKPLRYGKEFLSLPLDGLTYTVSPTSFFQANWKLNQVLVKFIKDSLVPLQDKRILDLYSGAGNFSLPLAPDAREVIAVEENPSSVEDGRRNLQLNQIKNAKFLNIPVERYNIENYGPFDIVLVDPPRAGLSDKLANNLLKTKAGRIVYISCNPSTLARDLKKLSNRYAIESVRLVDFFPQTYHIETLVFLSPT